MEKITLYKEKWEPIKDQLKVKFKCSNGWIPDIPYGSIFNGLDRSKTKSELCKEAFNKSIEMSNTTNVDDIYFCAQRMAHLCQMLDYGPAGVWFGMFCEEVLEKYDDAQEWYNRAAGRGDGMGMYRVGLLYVKKLVPVHEGCSVKRCFTDALENGVPEAQEILDKYF